MAGSMRSSKPGVDYVIHKVYSVPHVLYHFILAFCFLYFSLSTMSSSLSVYVFLYTSLLFPPVQSLNTCMCRIRPMIVPFTRNGNRGAAGLPFLSHASLLDARPLLDACHPSAVVERAISARDRSVFPISRWVPLPSNPPPPPSCSLASTAASGTAAVWQHVNAHLISLQRIIQVQREWLRDCFIDAHRHAGVTLACIIHMYKYR